MKLLTNKKPNNNLGFSLIELLIVVAIIGIISAIAYPSYTQHLKRAGRSEGSAMLLQVMERQENFYRDNLTYTAGLASLGYGATVESETGRYAITAGACPALAINRCVALTATAQNKQAGDGNITLTSRGEKSANWPE